MAGYTRQSTGSIINGSPITAPPLNTEFNQLQSAFNATGGHTHTGGTGDAPKINLATSVTGFLPSANGGMGGKNKMDATTTPVVTNDNTEGYAPGSMWENTTTGRIYICVGSSTGAAVWRELLQVQNGNAVLPAATDTVDLGSNSVRFQDLFLSAGIAAAGNATIGGTLNVTAATALGSTLGVTGDTTLVNLAATGTTTITSIDLNSGAIDGTSIGTTTPAAGTFTTLNANTSLVAATADINGGTVDGATIGASTPSTGAFTDLDASGTATLATVDINAGAIDGTVIGASSHTTGKFTTLQSTGHATLATVNIDGGTIDGATVGATTASSGAFTTLTASGGITGALTGNVTGNVTGSLSGGTVTGNVTGDLTGNVTAGSGSSSFNDVTISGTLNMDANSAATITNLSAPTNDNDAARKIDVDNAVANLVDSAPDSLNTLNELAAALADDDDAFNTLNTAISTKLPKAGGIMTGAIAMSTNKITGVGDPTAAQDVSSKAYTDAQRDTRLATAGGTMSGEVAMGNNKITGLATPVASTDASSKGYVDGVLGSATVASDSATTATTQAGIATTKAGEAAGSATAAAGSATTASTALSTFQNQYLGAQGSAPTADPDGSALDVGDLYFDTTAGAMKVYSANGWTNAGSSVNGTTNRYSYTAQANQTVFAATYDAGYVDIFLNGVKQVVGSTKDVTATTGTSIVFNSATSVNDVVDIIGYGTFVLADHLTQTQSDARYVNLSGDTMTAPLHVQTASAGTVTASTQADDLIVENSTEGGMTIITPDDQSARIRFTSPSTNNDVGGATIFYRQNINKMNIGTGVAGGKLSLQSGAANETMILDGSGRVGIGVPAPAAPLSISGSAFNPAAGGYATGGIDLQGATAGNGNYTAGLGFRMGTRQSTAIITGVQDTTDSDRVGLAFFTNPDGSGATAADEVMRISSSGSVGIGTSSPSVDGLEVSGSGDRFIFLQSSTSNDGVYIKADSGGDGTEFQTAGGQNKFGFRTNGSLALTIDNSGVVEIPNSGVFRASSSNATKFVRMYAGGGTGKWDIYGNGANLRISDNMNAGVLAVDTGATFGGNVGVNSGSIDVTTTTSGLISAGAARQGSIIKLHHEAQWEAGYNSTPTDFLGAVEFSSGDGSGTGLAGEGVRAAIRAYVKDAYNNVGLSFETGGSRAEAMRIDHSGCVTKPLQPAFQAELPGNTNNFPIDTQTVLNFSSERWEQGNNYNTSTKTFTAPVAGKYQFNVAILLLNVDTAATYYQLTLHTSNDLYYETVSPNYSADMEYVDMAVNILADMDAGDTAYATIYQSGGGAQTDINATTSKFGCFLAC